MAEITRTSGKDMDGGSVGVRLAHIGIAVANLSEARETFAALLGSAPSPIEEVAPEGVRVSFFQLENCRIELLEGTRPDSPVSKFLAAGRTGVHHLAFSSPEGTLSALLESLRARQVPVLDDAPRSGAEGSKAIFVHPRGAEGVLVEFVEHQKRAEP